MEGILLLQKETGCAYRMYYVYAKFQGKKNGN